MIFTSSTRSLVRAAEPLWIAKFVLRLCCLALDIAGIALIGNIIQFILANFTTDSEYIASSPDPWPMVPFCVSAGWNIANIIVRLSRARPMHPGANVALDLLIWMGAAAAGTLQLLSAIADLGVTNTDDFYGDSYYNSIIQFGTLEAAAVGIAYAVMLVHIALFIWACCDTHIRNRATTSAHAAIMANAMVNDMQRQGMVGAAGAPGFSSVLPSQPLFTADGRQVSGFYGGVPGYPPQMTYAFGGLGPQPAPNNQSQPVETPTSPRLAPEPAPVPVETGPAAQGPEHGAAVDYTGPV